MPDRWTDLALAIESNRTSNHDHRNELQRRIGLLIEQDRCPPQAVGWVRKTQRASGAEQQIDLSKSADVGLKRHPAIALRNLKHLQDGALLSFIVTVDARKERVIKYSVGLAGAAKGTSEKWYARVDLDEKGTSTDPCTHAVLHCHVGSDPDNGLATRVPLPWLAPHDALDWLIAVADGTAPPGIDWSAYEEAQNKRRTR